MAELIPFADGTASISIGDLTVENGSDCIALRGSLDLTHDKRGLLHALMLRELLDQIVDRLKDDKDLPDMVAEAKRAKSVLNPFR